MSSHEKVSLRAKIILISLFFVTFAVILFFVSTMTSVKINERIKLEHDATMQSIEGFLKHFNEMNIDIANALFIKNQEFIESLQDEQERKHFLEKQSKIYASFVHSFEKAELFRRDDGEKNTHCVEKVFSTNRAHSEFEVVNGVCHYEIVLPVYVDSIASMAIKLSYRADLIMKKLYTYYHHKIALVYHADHKMHVVYASSRKFNRIFKKGITQSTSTFISVGGKKYSLFKKVENQKGNIELLSLYDATPNLRDREDVLYNLSIIMLAVLAIASMTVNFIVNHFLRLILKREEEIEAKVNELSFQARHSTLTKLPNFITFQEEMKKLHHSYVIIMLKIDNVDILKTTYGMEIVKSAIKEASKSLKINLPNNAYLYHTEFDEFTIILEKPSPRQALLLASQIKAYFSVTPIMVENILMHLTLSIGISKEEYDKQGNIDLYSQANIALLEAIHQGRSLITTYENDMSKIGSYAQLSKNIAILQKNLEEEMLVPFYQPIVDVQTGKTYKYEALARIKEGDEIVSPYRFLEAAKVSGLNSSLTKQMIQKTFLYFDSTHVHFSINVTRQDLLEGYLPKFLEAKTKRHNISPSQVTLEILEDVIIDQDEEIIEQINTLSEKGFVIAIDDFGVESSNMSKLTQLKASFIKIDGSFIKDLDTNQKHRHIVESLVFIGKKLDMKIVAEFVHNEAVFQAIKELGIDYAQGYYFSEPRSTIDFE